MSHLWDSIEKYAHGILTDADDIWQTDIVPYLKNAFTSIWKANVAVINPIIKQTMTDLEGALVAAAASGSAHGLVNTIGGIALQAAKDVEKQAGKTSLATGLSILATTFAQAANHPAVVAAVKAQTEAGAAAAAEAAKTNPNVDQTPGDPSQGTTGGLGAADTHSE